MNTTLSRRERKKQKTRQGLMEAALRLFREQGYDDTTVEQITEAADVAKGTFFNYFETKEAILPALAEWGLQKLKELLLPEKGAPASPVERIKLTLRLMTQDPLTNPSLARRLFTAVMKKHEGDNHPGRALARLLADQVRQGQEAGEIRADLDPIQLSTIIRALFFQQMITWYHGYRPAPLPEMLDNTVDLLLEGAAGPEWRRAS